MPCGFATFYMNGNLLLHNNNNLGLRTLVLAKLHGYREIRRRTIVNHLPAHPVKAPIHRNNNLLRNISFIFIPYFKSVRKRLRN